MENKHVGLEAIEEQHIIIIIISGHDFIHQQYEHMYKTYMFSN